MKVRGTRAVIYTRISRDDSGEGESNKRQEAECRTLAQQRGWEVVEVVPDISMSAYSGHARPGWERVRGLIQRDEVDIVIAWKLDRVTRTVAGLVDIVKLAEDHDAAIATADGTLDLTSATGKATAAILAAVAQMEVELKAERQRLANSQRRAQGRPWGAGWRPFGYTLQGDIVPDEAAAIREAARSVLEDGATIKSIARHWDALGLRSSKANGSNGWTSRGVRSVLMHPRNIAAQTYRGEITGEGEWEPILDRDTFSALIQKLSDPTRIRGGSKKSGRTALNLLSGIARCSVCNATLAAGMTAGKLTYRCNAGHCSVNREEIDELVRSEIRFYLPPRTPDRHADTDQLVAKLSQLSGRRDEVTNAYAGGRMDLDTMLSVTSEIKAQIADVERDLEAAQSSLSMRIVGAEFGSLSLSDQRSLLNQYAMVTVYPRKPGRGSKPAPAHVDLAVNVTGSWQVVHSHDRPADAD